MNRNAIVGLLVLAALAPSCGGGGAPSKKVVAPPATWQTQQRVPTTSDLRAVNFANEGTGLIGGKDGTIFRTDDGGSTWMQHNFTPASRTGEIGVIRAMNKLVIAAGTDQATGNGRFWKSTDTITWTTEDVAATGTPYQDVTMSSPGTGPQYPVNFACLRLNGTVDVTPASGAPYSASSGTWTNAFGLYQLGNGLGYVCGDLTGAGQIRKTIDSGANFTTETLPAGIKTLRRVFITQVAQRAFAVGDNTVNGGEGTLLTKDAPNLNWYVVPNLPAGLPSLRSVHFPTGEFAGWVVGDNGTIYRVTQEYDPINLVYNWVWTNQNPGNLVTSENLYSVCFIGNEFGWIVGDKGTVLKTTNGSTATGPWWTKIDYGSTGINWNAISFTPDGVKGIAVGNAVSGVNTARIFRTIDGGAIWTPMTTGIASQNLLGASVPRTAGTVAYVCGANGILLRNPDVWGVGSWTTVTGITGTDTYRAVHFPLAGDKGVCVGQTSGNAPVLLHTVDGVNWAAPTLPGTVPIDSYHAVSSNPAGMTVYASGDNGVISVSTDSGTGFDVWSDITPATGLALTLPAVQSPEGSANRVIAAASDGNVYKLSTVAPAWTPVASIPWGAEKPISMAFQNDLNGLVVTDGGGVYYIDGAATWTKTYPHTKTKPRCLWMSPTVPGLGYIGCDDGVIMKTMTSGH